MNVNHEELDAVAILEIQVVETHGSPYVRRSGIATEDERHWFLTLEVREADGILAVYVT